MTAAERLSQTVRIFDETPIYRRDGLVGCCYAIIAMAHSLRNVREPGKDSGETVDEGASSIVGGRSIQAGSATRFGSLRRLHGSDAVSKSAVRPRR